MQGRSFSGALIFLTVMLCAAVAHAEVPNVSAEARASARQHTKQAQTHYNLGRFDDALREYSAAYELFPHPAFLFNLGQCHRELGNFERATFFFEGYLRELPEAANREVVEELLNESRAALQRERDQEALEAQQAADSASAEAAAAEAAAEAAAAERAAAEAAAAAANRQNGDERPPIYRRWWFWTIIGTAVAGTAVGLGVGLSGGDDDGPQTGSLGRVDWR